MNALAKAVCAAAGTLFAVVLVIVVILTDDGTSGCPTPAPMGQGLATDGKPVTLAGFNSGQLALARDIVAEGERRGISETGITSALMAALTESGLRNYANSDVPQSLSFPHDVIGTDHDSVGPFQMRASVHAGHMGGMAGLMDPNKQIAWFYDTLQSVPGWQTKDPGDLAQAVERSASPDAYAAKRATAGLLYKTFRGAGGPNTAAVPDPDTGPCDTTPDTQGSNDFGARVLAAGMRERGLPYVWGGGNANGPTGGGFDCSGLVLYSIAQASNGRIVLGHYTGIQQRDPRGVPIPFSQVQPGDIIYFTTPGDRDSHHTGIYAGRDSAGNDLLLNAPTYGTPVRVQPLAEFGTDRMDVRRFDGTQQDSTEDVRQ